MYAVRWLVLLAFLGLLGCQGGSDSAKEKVYDIKGKVVSVDRDQKKVMLDHEAIPGRMRAMQMPFDVTDLKHLEGLQPGDQVEGKVTASNVITELHKR